MTSAWEEATRVGDLIETTTATTGQSPATATGVRTIRASGLGGAGWRRRHRHLFAWVVVAGGALVVGLVVLALLQSTGLLSWLQSTYFTATAWVLPDDWEAGFQALPGWVHAVAGVGVVAVMAGLASGLTEAFD